MVSGFRSWGSKGSCSEEVGVYRDSRHSLNVFGLFSLSLGKMCSKNRESLNLPLARGWADSMRLAHGIRGI